MENSLTIKVGDLNTLLDLNSIENNGIDGLKELNAAGVIWWDDSVPNHLLGDEMLRDIILKHQQKEIISYQRSNKTP